jgi:hypothetical protein
MFPGTRATTKVRNGRLAGLWAGMILTSDKADIGVVQQIRTADDKSVSVVIVENAEGRFYAVPADRLTLRGGVLSITTRVAMRD